MKIAHFEACSLYLGTYFYELFKIHPFGGCGGPERTESLLEGAAGLLFTTICCGEIFG